MPHHLALFLYSRISHPVARGRMFDGVTTYEIQYV